MSADGKISDWQRSPARFGSQVDKTHLEQQIAQMDGVLFGATTLRSYETSLPITCPQLLQQRQAQGLPPQPVHIVCSVTANFNPQMRFFEQSIPRWLITTSSGAILWENTPQFHKVIIAELGHKNSFNWLKILSYLNTLGWQKLGILGGGELVASLLQAKLVDELYLTICPVILGGSTTPTPVAGKGFTITEAPWLKLVSVRQVGEEIFIHYRLRANLLNSSKSAIP